MASALDLGVNHNSAMSQTNQFISSAVGKAADFTRNIDTHVGNAVDGFFAIPDKISQKISGKGLDELISMAGNSMSGALSSGKDAASSTMDYSAYSGGSASASTPSTPQLPQYLDAPLAEHYKMSASTAYQEALANTAYQRKVKDLKAAGLNPVLGFDGSGAASFYGTPADGSTSFSSGYSYGSSGSAKTTSGLVGIGQQLLYNAPTFMAGVVGAFTGGNPASTAAAYSLGNVIKNVYKYSLSN